MFNFSNQSSLSLSLSADPRVAGLNHNKLTVAQQGRSMIEMLGVLGIIGVLSVGGIAGYSKAMMQYKINKTVDQISQIVGNIRTMYGSQKSYDGLTTYSRSSYTIFRKGHLIPDEMWNGSDTIENAFGGSVYIEYSKKKNNNDNKAFTIVLDGLPEEACMALSTYDWGSGSSSGLIAIAAGSASSTMYSATVGCNGGTGTWNTYACPNGSNVSVPMPVHIATEGCSAAGNEDQYRNFGLKFY